MTSCDRPGSGRTRCDPYNPRTQRSAWVKTHRAPFVCSQSEADQVVHLPQHHLGRLVQSHGQVQLARPNPWTTWCSVQREERASASYDQHMGWEAVGQRRTTTSARLKYATTAECRRAPCVNTSFRHSSGSHRGARLLRRFTQCECRWFLAHPSMRAARLPHVGQQARPARR